MGKGKRGEQDLPGWRCIDHVKSESKHLKDANLMNQSACGLSGVRGAAMLAHHPRKKFLRHASWSTSSCSVTFIILTDRRRVLSPNVAWRSYSLMRMSHGEKVDLMCLCCLDTMMPVVLGLIDVQGRRTYLISYSRTISFTCC